MRKLASIQKVVSTAPIEGADKIELVFILGWQVVATKGEYKAGDLVVFYEIDSWLPATDPRYNTFEERFSNWGDKRGMRLKTIKLRKQLSQGLVMPLDKFPEIKNPSEGDNVTDILKIEKWEPIEKPVPGRKPGESAGKRFPAFIRKTDQDRIQNVGAMVERYLDEGFEVTMKLDGSSMTVFMVQPSSKYYKDAKSFSKEKLSFLSKVINFFKSFNKPDEPIYGVCSRNVMLSQEGTSNFHKAVEVSGVKDALELTTHSYAIQGEVIAPDIQENYEKVKDVEFHIFDIFDIDTQEYLLPEARQRFCDEYELQHVPILWEGSLRGFLEFNDGDSIVQKCLDKAEGDGYNPGVKREGIVWKSLTRDFSWKAVSNSYLLKTGK